jgi:nitric oxide synthase-interacting protein
LDQDPVCTPDGYLYSREAILESLLQQKKANKRKYAVWEAQQEQAKRKVSRTLGFSHRFYVFHLFLTLLSSVRSSCPMKANLHYLPVKQEGEREAVEAQTQLLAFDRQNHMGASDTAAMSLKNAIQEEAEAMLKDKKVVNSAVNIAGNTEKIKVWHQLLSVCSASHSRP